MRREKLKAEFLRLCKTKLELGMPLGTEVGQEKKVTTFSLLYRTAKVQLVYRPGTVAVSVVSTLYCRVYPDKKSVKHNGLTLTQSWITWSSFIEHELKLTLIA